MAYNIYLISFLYTILLLNVNHLFFCLYSYQDIGPAATGDEGYFVPPVKGTSQSQVNNVIMDLAGL